MAPAPTATDHDVLNALRRIEDPDLHRDIVSLGFIKETAVEGDKASCVIELTTPACPVRDQMKEQARQLLAALPGIKQVEVKMTTQVRSMASPAKEKLIPKVKNVVAVASGKGGVGKSTVCANLALALAAAGAKVGIMDADVYGPSIPTILGLKEKPVVVQNRIMPAERFGIKVISMGFFVPVNEAVIWRGPMLHKMVNDFLGAVEWGELDYLVIDLPPGTGDIQLSLCQTIPITGALIVSTPQDVAWNVAQKAIVMFDKLNAPVLGIAENMSGYVCSHCGQKEDIFGQGGAERAAARLGIPYLGSIPLGTSIRTTSDQGDPVVHSDPESASSRALIRIAENLAAQISIRNIQGDTRPVPSEIGPTDQKELKIKWSDGKEAVYASRDLRIACPCAGCVHEVTGKRLLDPASVPADVRPLAVNKVGRYALHIVWSDGHNTGLYAYEKLRKMAK